MNTIVKILVLAALAWFGWNRPYRDFVSTYFPSTGVTPSRLAILKMQSVEGAPVAVAGTPGRAYAPVARTAPLPQQQPPDRSWMWDRTSLDRVPGRK